jgi:amino acid transporter
MSPVTTPPSSAAPPADPSAGPGASLGANPGAAPQLARVLGLSDIVFLTVVAVVGTRWITRGARAGAPSVTLWLLAWLLFLLPLAFTVSELSSRYPEQGGLYAWVRRAFGPAHAFVCGWCLWVNNLFYFPALLLFAAANVAVMFGRAGTGLAESQAYSVTFVLVVLWLTVALNIRGYGASRWLQNAGAVANWIPAVLLTIAGVICLWLFGSATRFAPDTLLPREDALSTISLWSAMCFAFSGFELGSYSGAEIKDPRRTIPRGIFLSGLAITFIYIASSTAVLIALPAEALSERSGIADAVDLVASRIGLSGLGVMVAGLVALGSIAGNSSWFAGSARISYAAATDRMLPDLLARLHPRYRTPHVGLIVQGVLATLILLGSVFLTLTGAQGTVQSAYDELVNLTILIYFLPYLYLFVAVIVLRLRDRSPLDGETRPIPGGRVGLWLVAGCGFLATAISMALLFVPPPGTTNVLNFELKILLNTAIVIGLGAAIYAWLRRPQRPTLRT